MKRIFALCFAILLTATVAFATELPAECVLQGTLTEIGFSLEELADLLPSGIEVTMENNSITFTDNKFSNIDIQPPFVKGTLNNGVWTIEIPEGEDLSETRIEAWPKGGNYYAFSLDGQVTNIRVETDRAIIMYHEGVWKIDALSTDANYAIASFDAQGNLLEYTYKMTFEVDGEKLKAEVYYGSDGELQQILMYKGLMPKYSYSTWKGEGYWYDSMWEECEGPGTLAGLDYAEVVACFPPLIVIPEEPAEQ